MRPLATLLLVLATLAGCATTAPERHPLLVCAPGEANGQPVLLCMTKEEYLEMLSGAKHAPAPARKPDLKTQI